jgi:hypothetical protein
VFVCLFFSCVRVNLSCSQVEICIKLKVSDILLTAGVVHEKYINKMVWGLKVPHAFSYICIWITNQSNRTSNPLLVLKTLQALAYA